MSATKAGRYLALVIAAYLFIVLIGETNPLHRAAQAFWFFVYGALGLYGYFIPPSRVTTPSGNAHAIGLVVGGGSVQFVLWSFAILIWRAPGSPPAGAPSDDGCRTTVDVVQPGEATS